MTTEMAAGFALGLAGSVHCAAMCGPLVLALRPVRTVTRVALYHGSRIAVYATAGLLGGAIGMTSQIAGLGRIISIAAGVCLILLAARRIGLTATPDAGDRVNRLIARVMIALQRATAGRPVFRVMAAGATNALLPCGLVYAALAAATALGTAASAVTFMLSFGLGTVPTLAAMSLLARSMPSSVRTRLRFAAPLALAAVGILLIARGFVVPHAHARAHQPAAAATVSQDPHQHEKHGAMIGR